MRADRSRSPRRLALMIGAVSLAASLSACGSDDSSTATTKPDTATTAVGGVLPPVVVDTDDLAGTTVDVTVGGVIDLVVPTGTESEWTAEVADDAVATFTPGRVDGGATFNPGITGVTAGTTEVHLHHEATAATVSFTVQVRS